MATTAPAIAATQNALRLALNSSSGAGSIALTQSQLIALCANGPLKSLLTGPLFDGPPGPGATSWANLANDARMSVYGLTVGSPAISGGYSFTTDSGVNHFNLFVSGTGTVNIELRFDQSAVR